RQRHRDRFRLPIHSRRGETHLRRAIVVKPESFDHGRYVVAIAQRLLQSFENHNTDPVTRNCPLCSRVKGPAMAIRRKNSTFLIMDATALGESDGNSGGEGEIALIIEEALAGLTNRHQRGGASRIDVYSRPPEVQLISDVGGQVILVVAHIDHPLTDQIDNVWPG